ncbi:anthranilate synthase family protein [Streptomyces sp. NPDC054864]
MSGYRGPVAEPDLLGEILAGDPKAFALLHRPESRGRHVVEVLTGRPTIHEQLTDLPLPAEETPPGGRGVHDVLAVVPFRQITERGYPCRDDRTPLVALQVEGQQDYSVAEVLDRLPDVPVEREDIRAEPDDDAYADLVRRIVTDEIGRGAGSNFVLRRTFSTELRGLPAVSARTLFRRLLERESGAYWTFLVHTGERTFVGACPERHLSLSGGRAVMNPVSGTYRYPATGPTVAGALEFLGDQKEADELYMVVDEELKMMAGVCDGGGRVRGPHLKEMGRLAHSEYYIEGSSRRDPRDILRQTLFAPTVTGSPLESAFSVIARHEPRGRGYYSGVAALIGRDEHGMRRMDSSILIRTADIDADGRLEIGVGATIVRHSDPAAETAETHAKAAALLGALDEQAPPRLADSPAVRAALAARNDALSGFWLGRARRRTSLPSSQAGQDVLVVDGEDTFTGMLVGQLTHLGLHVDVRRHDADYDVAGYSVVVMGPGPGDPRDCGDPKIVSMKATIRRLLTERRPFLAVCLSHQLLCAEMGLPLIRRGTPHQGVQRTIDLFGEHQRVGFYNTFAARLRAGGPPRWSGGQLAVSSDLETGEIHDLRGPGFASAQFHPESLLTEDGPSILVGMLASLDRQSALA